MANLPKKLKAQDNREFQTWWTEKYGMINKGDKALCVLCSGSVVCRTSSVKRHYETNHKTLSQKSDAEQNEFISNAIKEKNKLSTSMSKYINKDSHTCVASFSAANVIAQHGKPFCDGEFLKEAWLTCAPSLFDDFENKDNIIQRIKDIPLSRNTVKDRILKMAENVTEQQKTDIKSSPFISLCLDESTDVTKSARLAVFVRYFVGNDVKEEFISLLSLSTTTKGADICTAVVNSLSEKEINLSKVVSVTTDGAPSMVGKINVFFSLFQTHIGHTILGFHCIIHQQVLCAKAGFESLDDIMAVVTKIVNFISAQALNKRKFDALLDEVNSVYNGLLMYNNVRWLSRGNVLQRFVDCLEEIRLFLYEGNKTEKYPQLMDAKWLAKLMYFTDLCQHLNDLNLKLQGTNKTVIIMIDVIRAFEAKLQIFRKDVVSKNYKYFPNLKKFAHDLNAHEEIDEASLTEEVTSVVNALIEEFSSRFLEFKGISDTFKFIIYPDVTQIDKLNLMVFDWLEIAEIEMELVDFQSSSIWGQKFVKLREDLEIIEKERLSGIINKNADSKIMSTWNSIPDTYNCLKKLAFAILTIFPSTYACESLFSVMNNIKNSNRSNLSDDSSSSCILLKITNYEPDIDHLASKMQHQKSH